MAAEDGDDRYVCTLGEDSLKLAKDELYEVPTDRISSVQTLRAWVLSQKHMKCPTDTAFLLKYLRGAKFSQLRARELIENTMSVMTKMSDWFKSIDTTEPAVLEYIKSGSSLPLPKRDKMNRRILLIRPGVVDVKNKYYSVANEMRSSIVTSTLNGKDEMTQVHGYVLLFDYTNFSMKHVKASWSLENSKKQSKVWQDCTPGRVKAFHIYNAGVFFDTMMSFFRPFMKKKFQERIHVHENLESLYKYVPMECLPEDYLPDDFKGPTIGTLAQCIENHKNTVTSPEFRREMLELTKPEYGIDAKLKPDLPQESFRKLNIE